MRTKLIEIKTLQNNGKLSVLEEYKDIPFKIKRVYYVYDVPRETVRGYHAHKELDQVLWCPYGSIEIMLDNGKEKRNFVLNKPNQALIVNKGYWHEMTWKKEGSILCVAASDYYEEADYIRNYDEFLRFVQEGYWENENQF